MARNPVPKGRAAHYARIQTAIQTSFSGVDITDAFRVTEVKWNQVVDPAKRRQYDAPHDGGLKSLAGPKRAEGTITVERTPPSSAGDLTAWQHRALWEGVPCILDDSGSVIVITPTSGRVPFVHWTPIELATYEPNGRRRAAYNCQLAWKSTKAEPGGIILDTFDFVGAYVADADSTVDDVAEVSTITIDTYAEGTWSVLVKDDIGNYATVSYPTTGEVAADVASELASLIDALSFAGATDAGAVITATGTVGRPLTFTVTEPAGGASTVAQTTAAVNFAELPTYENDATPIVYFGATITHLVNSDAPLNVGAWELTSGMEVQAKQVGDDANGYGLPRVPRVEEAMLSFEFDVTDPTSFDAQAALAASTEVSWQWVQGTAKVVCPQATYEKLDDGERAGDLTRKGSLHLHGSGSASDMWRMEI